MTNIEQFISRHVTERDTSLFASDIEANRDALSKSIHGKSMLVIGGAGSIGSSFIKACLPFRPKSLVVVDISENGFADMTRDLRSTREMYVPDDYVPYPIDYAPPRCSPRCSRQGASSISWRTSLPPSTSGARRTPSRSRPCSATTS